MIKIDGTVLPCGHTKNNIPCFQTQDLSKVICTTIVAKEVPGCNHLVDVKCPDNVSASTYRCPQPCSSFLGCGHQCRGTCGQCKPQQTEKGLVTKHKPCTKQCGKSYGTCNHLCKRQCHSGEDCGPCTARCEVSFKSHTKAITPVVSLHRLIMPASQLLCLAYYNSF
jgi:hypothetical protein